MYWEEPSGSGQDQLFPAYDLTAQYVGSQGGEVITVTDHTYIPAAPEYMRPYAEIVANQHRGPQPGCRSASDGLGGQRQPDPDRPWPCGARLYAGIRHSRLQLVPQRTRGTDLPSDRPEPRLGRRPQQGRLGQEPARASDPGASGHRSAQRPFLAEHEQRFGAVQRHASDLPAHGEQGIADPVLRTGEQGERFTRSPLHTGRPGKESSPPSERAPVRGVSEPTLCR